MNIKRRFAQMFRYVMARKIKIMFFLVTGGGFFFLATAELQNWLDIDYFLIDKSIQITLIADEETLNSSDVLHPPDGILKPILQTSFYPDDNNETQADGSLNKNNVREGARTSSNTPINNLESITDKVASRNKTKVLSKAGQDQVRTSLKPRVLSKPGQDLVEEVTLPPFWNATKEHLQLLSSRRNHVREVCHTKGLDTPNGTYRMNAWEFIVSNAHHLVWCNVFKAASSTWMWNFNLLAGYTERELLTIRTAPVELARRRYPRPTVQQLSSILKREPRPLSFIITRHPFVRLVSVYRNKILTANGIYVSLFPKIFKKYTKYGPPVPRISKTGASPSKRGGKNAPSFSQFVQYILDLEKEGLRQDMHWIPQSRFCTPCLVDFEVYAKTETLDEDGNYIIFKSGIDRLIHPKTINRSVGESSETEARTLMCQLTEEQFQGLLKLYRLDFELFQYEPSPYNQCNSSDVEI